MKKPRLSHTPKHRAAPAATKTSPARKYLLLDPALHAWSRNIAVEVGRAEKSAANPLFGQEYPWEPHFDNMYPTAMWDEEERIYKCWYNPFVVYHRDRKARTRDLEAWTTRESGLVYATSKDGLRWRKPLMAKFPFDGRPSNVVLRNAHGVGVIKDRREPDPKRRYKMVLKALEPDPASWRGGIATGWSPDGLHWSEPRVMENLNTAGDTHNNVLWAPSLEKYVFFTRDWGPAVTNMPEKVVSAQLSPAEKIRVVARMESADFEHWSPPQVILRGMDDYHQIYSMQVIAYEGIYLGLPAILDVITDRVQTELAWSRDTVNWHRISPGKPLVGNSEKPGDYDWGCVYCSKPVIREKEIRIYYGATDYSHTGIRQGSLALATLRPDGFAGAEPVDKSQPGELVTVPLPWSGERKILITADLDAGGSIQALFLDAADGREIGRSDVIVGQQRLTRASLPLPEEAFGPVSASSVKIRFLISRAMLYCFEI